MSGLTSTSIPPSDLLLDPNNYRFQTVSGFLRVEETRFHERRVQDTAFERLKKGEALVDLKRSIIRNGYMPIDQIVVRPYKYVDGKYVVIEGNRRTAAVRWILEDHEAGVLIRPDVLDSLANLPAVVAEAEGTDEAFRASLMGIRHVSGIKEWDGYQRARLIVEMRDALELEAQETSERLGLSAYEVNRRYRAFKALQQFQNDDDFGDHASANMYPIFHEAVSLPIVRRWLGWNEESVRFENDDNRYLFYGLITPSTDDRDRTVPPKLSTFSHVRELRMILAKPQAKNILLDPHRTLQEAITVGHQDELERSWTADVSSALAALKRMSIEQLKNLTSDNQQLLEELQDLVGERLKDRAVFVANTNA